MNIRPPRPADAGPLAALLRPIVLETTITFSDVPKSPADLEAAFLDLAPGYLVAVEQDRLLGYACYFPFRSGTGYRFAKEHSVAVAPEAHGRGVGRALMAALEQVARGEGVCSLWAGVSGENAAGLAFHAAIGFHERARLPRIGHKFGRWLDLVLMEKRLDNPR